MSKQPSDNPTFFFNGMPTVLLSGVVSFLVGLWLGSFVRYIPFSIITLLIVFAIGLTWHERQGRLMAQRGLVLYTCLLSGVGLWHVGEWQRSSPNLLSQAGDQKVFLSGVIAEPVRHAPGRMTMIIEVASIGEGVNNVPAQGTLRLTWRHPDAFVYRGDVVSLRTRLRAPFGTRNPGGFDYGAYLQQRGIEAVAMIRGPNQIYIRSQSAIHIGSFVWHQIDQWRNQVRQAVLLSLTDPARALFLGMIVGEQSYIDQEIRDDFMTTGTVHIISISGSHLGLLAFISFMSIRGLTRRMPAPWLERLSCTLTPKQLAVLMTVPLVVFYTLLSGAHVATVRSLMMIVLYVLAVWFGHERHIFIALGISAGITTLFNPSVIYDLSFQLSYLSVLAIAMALRWTDESESEEEFVPSWRANIKKWLAQYGLISVSATFATLPLVAFYFNQVAWLGVLANMVVVPFVGFCVVPLGLFSSILTLVFGLESLPLAWVNQFMLDSVSSLVEVLANIPGAEWHVASPALFSIVVFYVCLLIAFISHRTVFRIISMVLVLVLTIWWIWSPRQILESDTLRTTFLDVGQGDATLVELPDGQTLLIDGGAAYERWDMGRMVVGPYLWDRGIRRIDHVVATHPQLDHVGGLAWIIKNFDIRHYWTNGIQRSEPFYERLQQAVREKNLPEQIAWAGQDLVRGNSCHVESLNPPQLESDRAQAVPNKKSGSELNNRSIVLSITCGAHSILLMADAEVEALERMARDPAVHDATLIKIPHHGAKSSFSAEWFNQIRGTVAVVSAGQRNRYGHPAPSVLKHYDQQGIDVFRTDQDGAVVVKQPLGVAEMVIRTTRDQVLSEINGEGNIFEQETKNLHRLWVKWTGGD